MQHHHPSVGGMRYLIMLLTLISVIAIEYGYTHDSNWYKLLYISIPLLSIFLILLKRQLDDGKERE